MRISAEKHLAEHLQLVFSLCGKVSSSRAAGYAGNGSCCRSPVPGRAPGQWRRSSDRPGRWVVRCVRGRLKCDPPSRRQAGRIPTTPRCRREWQGGDLLGPLDLLEPLDHLHDGDDGEGETAIRLAVSAGIATTVALTA